MKAMNNKLNQQGPVHIQRYPREQTPGTHELKVADTRRARESPVVGIELTVGDTKGACESSVADTEPTVANIHTYIHT